jgi:hypothetical protein
MKARRHYRIVRFMFFFSWAFLVYDLVNAYRNAVQLPGGWHLFFATFNWVMAIFQLCMITVFAQLSEFWRDREDG